MAASMPCCHTHLYHRHASPSATHAAMTVPRCQCQGSAGTQLQPTGQTMQHVAPMRTHRRAAGVQRHVVAQAAADQEPAVDQVYSLQATQVLVETAMLAAVGGLAYLLSALLKLESTLGYFLPLPVVLSAMRGGPVAGVKTMVATSLLIVVLLGPLRAVSYILIHGVLAATLAALWRQKSNFWLCVVLGAAVRMLGQFAYLGLSSVTMNENLFNIALSNVYALLDQICASMGIHGAPSPVAILCLLFGLLSVNALCYVFLLQIVYRIILQIMGYSLGPLPGIIRKYLYAGTPDPEAAAKRYG